MERRTPVIKICGLKRKEDVNLCCDLGVDILGFVTEYPSPVPWNLTREEARALLADIPKSCKSCVVTGGTEREIIELAKELKPDYVQLHDRETAAQTAAIADALGEFGIGVIKAVFPDMRDLDNELETLQKTGVFALLADPRTPSDAVRGGRADIAFYRRVCDLSEKPVILAGGITPDNVAGLMQETGAAYIDVMSGVEHMPGTKDASKVKALLRAVRNSR